MIASQFFTTINFKIFLNTLFLLTFYLPHLRFWKDTEKLEQELKKYLNTENSRIYSFYNGRSALFHALKQLNLNSKDEVLVSWYTCVSVVNAILQAWWKPVYVDIDKDSLNMSIKDIEQKITSNTKVLIVQHTFWNPVNMPEIMKIAKKYNLIVIEDCAHALWASINNKKVWTFWDMSIFSTWRDKVISSVTWWFLLINNKNIKFKEPKLIPVSRKLAISNLMYNIIAYIAWKTYDIKLWKVIMYISRKFDIIPPILTSSEKACNFDNFYYQLPNSLAYLARKELKKIDIINQHRIKIANLYNKELKFNKIKDLNFAQNIYFNYPIIVNNIDKIMTTFRQYNIYLWNYWSWWNIVPHGTKLENCMYKKWTCPVAENIVKNILTLPTHFQVSLKQAEKICKIFEKDFSNLWQKKDNK